LKAIRDRHVGEIFNVRITEAANFTLFGDPMLLA
jgi:hypothetical protein